MRHIRNCLPEAKSRVNTMTSQCQHFISKNNTIDNMDDDDCDDDDVDDERP